MQDAQKRLWYDVDHYRMAGESEAQVDIDSISCDRDCEALGVKCEDTMAGDILVYTCKPGNWSRSALELNLLDGCGPRCKGEM